MAAIVIAITDKSASALGIAATAADPVPAVRQVARQLVQQGRDPALPVHITNARTGYFVSRIASLADATRIERLERYAPHPSAFNADGRRARGKRGGVKHRTEREAA